MAPRPPLPSASLETPPCLGEQTDENTRVTSAVVTNPNIEVKLYGRPVVRAAVHEERVDLWNGLASSPVAVTLRDRRNYVDLSDPARCAGSCGPTRFINLSRSKLADRRLSSAIAASRRMVSFSPRNRFHRHALVRLDPAKVIVLTEVTNPNLRMVDEVGLAMLAWRRARHCRISEPVDR
jgi:hypothetical protein